MREPLACELLAFVIQQLQDEGGRGNLTYAAMTALSNEAYKHETIARWKEAQQKEEAHA